MYWFTAFWVVKRGEKWEIEIERERERKIGRQRGKEYIEGYKKRDGYKVMNITRAVRLEYQIKVFIRYFW